MSKSRTIGRRIGIAIGAFVNAWFAALVVGRARYGSANVLVFVIAAIIGAGVYLEVWRRDRRSARWTHRGGALRPSSSALIALGAFGLSTAVLLVRRSLSDRERFIGAG